MPIDQALPDAVKPVRNNCRESNKRIAHVCCRPLLREASVSHSATATFSGLIRLMRRFLSSRFRTPLAIFNWPPIREEAASAPKVESAGRLNISVTLTVPCLSMLKMRDQISSEPQQRRHRRDTNEHRGKNNEIENKSIRAKIRRTTNCETPYHRDN